MCERTIAKYEEELCPTKEEKERQHQLLDAVFKKHQVVLHRTDIQQPPHIKEEEEDPQPPHIKEEEEDPQPPHIKEEEEDPQPPHIKEEEEDPQPPHIKEEEEDPQPPHIKEEEEDPQPPHIKEEEEDPQPPHIKEEEEEVWITQEGECLLGQEEDDVSKFPLTVVSVKTEEHEDKPPESSQLHHSPNVQRVSAGSHEEEWHTSVGQKELQAPSHIKEEQLHDEDEAQSLQLHHSQSEENREAELNDSRVGGGTLSNKRGEGATTSTTGRCFQETSSCVTQNRCPAAPSH
ncbi:uncharacterized protein [Nerophis lumbriciformis]|uniref:uncharacterized protein isoform X4 n=1 Tax=Nerophis lumbriciformis TaxID=546530 RepID=UPI003BA88525